MNKTHEYLLKFIIRDLVDFISIEYNLSVNSAIDFFNFERS